MRLFTYANPVIPEFQYGFMQGKGTQEQLLRVLNYVNSTLDRPRWKSVMVALDLTKAFDTVWHEALLFKLHMFNYPPYLIKLMRSYLSDRIMTLTTHLEKAQPKSVNYGVPQGSILGPLLFIIYLADMPKPHPNATVALFADDTSLLTSSNNIQRAKIQMSKALDTLLSYFETWRLIINPSKTQSIIFTGNANTPNTPL